MPPKEDRLCDKPAPDERSPGDLYEEAPEDPALDDREPDDLEPEDRELDDLVLEDRVLEDRDECELELRPLGGI